MTTVQATRPYSRQKRNKKIKQEMLNVQGDTKKRELLKNPTKIEEIQEKKNYLHKLDHYNLPFKRQ